MANCLIIYINNDDSNSHSAVIKRQITQQQMDENWLEIVADELRKQYEVNTFSVNDYENEWGTYWIPYSDYYGEVRFNIKITELTAAELFYYFGRNGQVEINAGYGGAGGNGDLFTSAVKIIELIGHILDVTEIIKTFSKYYSEPFVNIRWLTEYIYSKDVWTLAKVKKRFRIDNDNEAIKFMGLFGFKYDETSKKFNDLRYKFKLSQYMDGITIEEQYVIIDFFLSYYHFDKEQLEVEKRRLLSRLKAEIDMEKLNLIFRDLQTQIDFLNINIDDL